MFKFRGGRDGSSSDVNYEKPRFMVFSRKPSSQKSEGELDRSMVSNTDFSAFFFAVNEGSHGTRDGTEGT